MMGYLASNIDFTWTDETIETIGDLQTVSNPYNHN